VLGLHVFAISRGTHLHCASASGEADNKAASTAADGPAPCCCWPAAASTSSSMLCRRGVKVKHGAGWSSLWP